MAVPCVPLSPAHPSYVMKDAAVPGRGWARTPGAGAGLKCTGKKAIKAIFRPGKRVRRQAL